jgi:hypothetical protein
MRVFAALFVLLTPFAGAGSDVDPRLYQSMEWRGIGPFLAQAPAGSRGDLDEARAVLRNCARSPTRST